MTPPNRPSWRGAAASAALVLCSIAISLVAAEVALRLAIPSGFFIWKPHMSRTFHPTPGTMPGVSGESHFRTNSLGLRGDEPSDQDRFRILALGGSTTECLFLDQSEAWPQLLQGLLNADGRSPRTWVGNAGMSARNTRHHVMAMRHLPLREMKIDAVVMLPGINDLSIRLSQDAAYDPRALQDPSNERRLIAETFLGLARGDPRDPWFKQTALWQLARGVKALWFPSADSGAVQDDVGAVYDEWRRHRQQAARLIATMPDLGSALDEYRRNLREVAALAKANSVRLILLTQPTMWRPGLPPELDRLLWFGGVGNFQVQPGQPYYSVEALAEGIRRYNDELLQVCKEQLAECIDLTGLAKDTSVFYDDVHFNESGSRQVAQLVATYLMAHPPFSPR